MSSSQIPPKSRWHHYRFDIQYATSCFDHRNGVRGISSQSMASVANEAAKAAPQVVVCAANSLLQSLLRLIAAESLSRRVARLTAYLSFSFNKNICHFRHNVNTFPRELIILKRLNHADDKKRGRHNRTKMRNRLLQCCFNRGEGFTQRSRVSECLVAVQGFEPRTLRI